MTIFVLRKEGGRIVLFEVKAKGLLKVEWSVEESCCVEGVWSAAE